MSTERFVVLGAARAPTSWFRSVARWANSGALPVEFEKALSADELRVRLRNGRRYSALLVDAGLVGWDRDLAGLASDGGCAVVVVDGGPAARRWHDLGADAVLPADFSSQRLLDTLQEVAEPIARATHLAVLPNGSEAEPDTDGRCGRLVAVTGAGGVGRSTLAMALADGLAGDPRHRGQVLLADLALHAHQGLLHDAGDVVPGLSELVEAHRGGRPGNDEIRGLTFQVADRGYDLLLGLRRHRDWTALGSRTVAVALDALRRAYRLVVADVDADVEGEAESGSVDVEERNALARTALSVADQVVVVGAPTVVGLHAHVRVLRELLVYGIDPERLVAVVNRAPRNPGARAELQRALVELLDAATPRSGPVVGPLFVPERRRLDDLQRDGAALPGPIVQPLTSAVAAVLELLDPRERGSPQGRAPEPVAVGSLGSWGESDGEARR